MVELAIYPQQLTNGARLQEGEQPLRQRHRWRTKFVAYLAQVIKLARLCMADMSSMPSSTASASFPSVRAAQTGLLYTVTRNVTANFRSANYRSSWGGKRKGLTYSDVVLWSRRMIASKLQFCLNEFPCLYEMIGVFYKSLLAMADFVLNSSYPSLSV